MSDPKLLSLLELTAAHNWPKGFAKCIIESKDAVAFRFVIVDNSRSMSKRDGHHLVKNDNGNFRCHYFLSIKVTDKNIYFSDLDIY